MQTRLIRLRFRRRLRKGQRQVGDLGTQAEKQIEQHLLKRFERLKPVRRFVIGWLGLMVLLIAALLIQNLSLSGYYQTLQAVPGGIYREGVSGRFTNASPLYATGEADSSVSRLIFAGLFTYDEQGKLVGDLASDYSVDAHGTTYAVHLKPGLKWHDGQPLTSSDVAFTYKLIQNPDVQSPLQNGWQGIGVSTPDARTIVFKLPGTLAAFPYNMTNGIVPKHLLATVPPADMRTADFNTLKPVGAGPFVWQAIQVTGDGNPKHAQEQIALIPFAGYQAGKPKLQKFVVQVYADENQLQKAFAGNQLNGTASLNEISPELKNNKRVITHSLPLRAATMVFFRTSSDTLSDVKVRQALVKSADVPAIVKSLNYKARIVKEPLLQGQVGYDASLTQPKFDLTSAKETLDSAGWKVDKNGVRAKDSKQLTFSLTAADTADYRLVSNQLKQQWQQLGVKLNVQLLEPSDFQNALTTHSYDALLYGISIGVDPDVFVYWDSSQADIRAANRLNFSEYKNTTADTALEAGRTRLDPGLRAIKYKPFLQAWHDESPALALYQPRVLYLTNGNVYGLSEQAINTGTDRFLNVQNWQIRESKITN